MHPMLTPPARRLALLALAAVFATPASALDPACAKAISAANLKMIEAPAFHSIKQIGSMRFELLKVEGKLFKRMGAEPWGPAGMSLQEMKDAVRLAESLVQSCERGGRDTVGGIATEVFHFTVKDPTAGTLRAQVWIGARDGLPYREESSTVKGTTTYANVNPPR